MTTSKADERVLQRVDIYSSENGARSEFRGVASYLRGLFPQVRFVVLPTVFRLIPKDRFDVVAEKLAASRVKDPSKEDQGFQPMYGEIDYERRAIVGEAKVGGIVYDGRRLEEVFLSLLGSGKSVETASIVMTDRLVSTYSRDDMRHHLRTLVCGFPSMISVPGIVEAPAKPREFYFLKQQLETEGAGIVQLERLKSGFKGRFLDYDDPRSAEVIKGLALQAIVYHLTLDPFCEDKECRLYNSHWQEDLIQSQIRSGRLCKRHSKLVGALGRKPVISW